MRIQLSKENLKNPNGIEIVIEGIQGDPQEESPGTSVYIEHYEGKVLCHIWTDNKIDCQTIELT